MEQPEIEPRNGVVVARITKVQKAEKLLIDEEKPEKSMKLPWAAMQTEIEIRRILKGGENVPRRCNQESNDHSAEGMQALPRPSGKQLLRQKQIDNSASERKKHANKTFDQ